MRSTNPEPKDDDRTDGVSRDRIDELTSSWHSAVERLDRRYHRIAIRQTITSLLIVSLLIFNVAQRQRTDSQSDRNTKAMCALRTDLEQRIDSAERWLIENPKGIPGITPQTLRTTIDGQKRTIEALSVIRCARATS